MSNVARIDLRKLLRTIGEKKVDFIIDPDGDVMDDTKARERLASYITEGFPIVPLRKDTSAVEADGKDTSRLARLREKLRELQREQMRYTASYRMPPASLHVKICSLKDEIAECEAYMPRSMAKLLPKDKMDRSGIIRKMIKMHIAADYLTECAMTVRQTLDGLGLETCNLFPLVEQIEQRASKFAGIVCHPEFCGLTRVLTENDTLLTDMDRLTDVYLKDKLE